MTISLLEQGIVGIIGDRERVMGLVRGLILQLAALHSYDDVKLVFFYDPREYPMLSF